MLNEWFNFHLGWLSSTNLLWMLLMKTCVSSCIAWSHCWWYDDWFYFLPWHNRPIAGGMTVDFIFSVAQLCWIDTLFLLSVFWGSLTSKCTPLAPSACYLLWGTILVWGAPFSLGGHKQWFGGHRPRMPPVVPGLLEIVRVSTYIVLLLFPFSGLVVCFFVLNVALVSQN